MTRRPLGPPRIITRLLSFFVPPEEREFLLGDLEERYQEKANVGRARASAWYYGEAFRTMWQFLANRPPTGETLEAIAGSRGKSRWTSPMRDLRYAFRSLGRAPLFTATAILTLSIGIGGNTALFTVLDGVILKPLPFKDSERLMRLYLLMPSRAEGTEGSQEMFWSYPKYRTFVEIQNIFDEVVTFGPRQYTLTYDEGAETLRGEAVGDRYHSLLGVTPMIGRTFTPDEDDVPGRGFVAVIGHTLWQRLYDGSADVLTETLQLDGSSFDIVGVMPRDFKGLSGSAEVWVPISTVGAGALESPNAHSLNVIAHLRPTVSPDQAKAALEGLGRQVDQVHPSPEFSRPWGARARTLEEVRVDPQIRSAVLVLFGAVGFVLLIVCANLANLLLIRSLTKGREMAIRVSIGARRRHLLRQLMSESLVLALVGGAGGLILAIPTVRVLKGIVPQASAAFVQDVSGLTRIGIDTISVDTNALIFTFVIALVTGVLFGLAPALQASKPNLTQVLKDGGSSAGGDSHLKVRDLIVTGEVALTFVLLVGSVLTIRGLDRLLERDFGFAKNGVLAAGVTLPDGKYDQATGRRILERLQEQIRATPDVRAAGLHFACYPLSGGCNGSTISFPDGTPTQALSVQPIAGVHLVSPDYFRSLEIPVVEGRDFTDADRDDAQPVAIVSRLGADRFWGNESPIGKRIAVGGFFGAEAHTVVGIVEDVYYDALNIEPQPDVYAPLRQSSSTAQYLIVRSDLEPETLISTIRAEARRIDPEILLLDFELIEDRIAQATSGSRFSSLLLTFYAAIAVLLAILGIYGVTANAVRLRNQEIAIRVALGASANSILGVIARRSTVLVGGGIVGGLILSWALERVLRTLSTEVSPTDPLILVLAITTVSLLGVLANLIPARAALRVDPLTALKTD